MTPLQQAAKAMLTAAQGEWYEGYSGLRKALDAELAAIDADFLVVAQNGMLDELEVIKVERDEWKARCEFSFEQRDKLTAERDALKDSARLARLALDALEVVEPYINTTTTACRGDKCREPWCASCNTEEEAEASAQEGYRAAVKALSAIAALKAVL